MTGVQTCALPIYARSVTTAELQALLRHFPLSGALNHTLGMRELAALGRREPSGWQRHLKIAAALLPGSWALPAVQARAVAELSPALAITFWEQAVERGALHRDEVFRIAVSETAGTPGSIASWGRYAVANPRLLLSFAQMVPESEARSFFNSWWQGRAFTADLDPGEVTAFYQTASRWGTRAQFGEWMRHRANWRARDHREWARLLHTWDDDREAWSLLAAFTPEQNFPPLRANLQRESLETRWHAEPSNLVNAQELAAVRARDGESAASEEIVMAVAAREDAPWWFLQKAAHLHARRGNFAEAVTMLLKTAPSQ